SSKNLIGQNPVRSLPTASITDCRYSVFRILALSLPYRCVGPANCAWPACFPSQNSSIIFLLKAGMSSGLRLVTSPLSTTTFSSTQLAPAFFTLVLIAGQDVNLRPRTTSAAIKTQGP